MTDTEEQTQFFEELYYVLKQQLKPEGASLQKIKAPGNNAIREGISVRFEGQLISPTVYTDNFYKDFQNGVSVEEIAFYITDELTTGRITESDVREMNHDSAQHYLRTAVVGYKGNEEWLKEIPHERVADLALYAKWDFWNGYTVKVTDEILAHLKMTKEEMLKTAKGNMSMQARLRTMTDAIIAESIREGMPEELIPEIRENLPDSPFYVLNVNRGIDGAALAADPSVMKKVSRDFQEGYYILPSSIHEVLIVPKSMGIGPEELKETVYNINRQEVPIQERLSDNVYEFDGHSLKLAGQAETMERDIPGPDMGIRHRR